MENRPAVQDAPVEEAKSGKVFWIIVGVIFLIIAGYAVFKYVGDSNLTGQVTNEPAKFEYKSYSLINADQIKKECPYIRVGRCDAIGGEFGVGCWMRGVEILYEVIGIETKDMKCAATINKLPSTEEQIFIATSEPNIYKLTYKVDVRKNNEIVVCCEKVSSSEKLCSPKMDVTGVC